MTYFSSVFMILFAINSLDDNWWCIYDKLVCNNLCAKFERHRVKEKLSWRGFNLTIRNVAVLNHMTWLWRRNDWFWYLNWYISTLHPKYEPCTDFGLCYIAQSMSHACCLKVAKFHCNSFSGVITVEKSSVGGIVGRGKGLIRGGFSKAQEAKLWS